MGLDEQGFLWLSDPWVAATAIALAVGLLVWCHLRIAGDDFERPAAAPVHVEIPPPARAALGVRRRTPELSSRWRARTSRCSAPACGLTHQSVSHVVAPTWPS